MSATNLVLGPQDVQAEAIPAPPLRVSFSWTIGANLVYALCQFGMLSALAKLGNPSVVGQYALALAVVTPLFMLSNLQLRGVQSTDARNEYEFADYFTLRCLSTLLAVLVIAGVVIFAHYGRSTKLVILLVAAAKAIETFSDVIAGHLQKFELLDQVARALMLRGLASVTTFTIAFWITRNLVISSATLAVTWLVVIGLYDFRVVSRLLQKRVFIRFSFSVLRRLAWLSLPLGLVMALISLNTNIPRYLLESRLGTAELGIFASMAYLITVMNLIVSALGQSVCTRMSRLLAEGDVHRFKVLIGKLMGVSILLGLVGVAGAAVLGKTVLTIVYRAEYSTHVSLLIVLVIDAAVGAAASFLGFGMTAARCFRSQVPVMAATVLTAAILTLVLLPSCGLMGAGLALLASSVVQGIISYLALNSAIREQAVA
jgi:O-antigen/teichoic acid export membrane protein